MFGRKLAPAPHTGPDPWDVSAAVRIERSRAVGTHDAQVFKPVIITNAVDVVEDQGHRSPSPFLPLTTDFASPLFQSFGVEPRLQGTSVISRAGNHDLL
jgi:hypothetical protein